MSRALCLWCPRPVPGTPGGPRFTLGCTRFRAHGSARRRPGHACLPAHALCEGRRGVAGCGGPCLALQDANAAPSYTARWLRPRVLPQRIGWTDQVTPIGGRLTSTLFPRVWLTQGCAALLRWTPSCPRVWLTCGMAVRVWSRGVRLCFGGRLAVRADLGARAKGRGLARVGWVPWGMVGECDCLVGLVTPPGPVRSRWRWHACGGEPRTNQRSRPRWRRRRTRWPNASRPR